MSVEHIDISVYTNLRNMCTLTSCCTHKCVIPLVQCADIVGRAFVTGRVLTKHENELDHTRTHDQLQQTLQEVEKCGVAVG